MPTCAQFIEETKRCFGDARLSDQKLGDAIGFAQQTIAQSKRGRMSDRVALAIGSVLVKHGVIDHAGEVLLVAHAERDSDQQVRRTLMDYAKKVAGRASQKAAAAIFGAAVMLGLMLPPEARAARLAEAVGFEPTDGCPSPVFKFTVELNRINGLADFRLRNID